MPFGVVLCVAYTVYPSVLGGFTKLVRGRFSVASAVAAMLVVAGAAGSIYAYHRYYDDILAGLSGVSEADELAAKARDAARQGDLQGAREAYLAAIDSCQERRNASPCELAPLALGLGTTLRKLGESEAALTQVREATQLYRRCGQLSRGLGVAYDALFDELEALGEWVSLRDTAQEARRWVEGKEGGSTQDLWLIFADNEAKALEQLGESAAAKELYKRLARVCYLMGREKMAAPI